MGRKEAAVLPSAEHQVLLAASCPGVWLHALSAAA